MISIRQTSKTRTHQRKGHSCLKYHVASESTLQGTIRLTATAAVSLNATAQASSEHLNLKQSTGIRVNLNMPQVFSLFRLVTAVSATDGADSAQLQIEGVRPINFSLQLNH
jgi:hypothetical protein